MIISEIKVDYINHMGDDLSTVNAARVSFAKGSEWIYNGAGEIHGMKAEDEKLINYLAKHKHLSPFNHAFLSVRVKAPIFVARQLVKHEYMPWNEVSRRYVDSEPEFFIPDEIRDRAENVKQGSGGRSHNSIVLTNALKEESQCALNVYRSLLEDGMCPEQARMVLPQNTMTEWIWSGSLGAFCKMLKLRLDPHTQKETRDVAIMIHEIVDKHFPVSSKALLEN